MYTIKMNTYCIEISDPDPDLIPFKIRINSGVGKVSIHEGKINTKSCREERKGKIFIKVCSSQLLGCRSGYRYFVGSGSGFEDLLTEIKKVRTSEFRRAK